MKSYILPVWLDLTLKSIVENQDSLDDVNKSSVLLCDHLF